MGNHDALKETNLDAPLDGVRETRSSTHRPQTSVLGFDSDGAIPKIVFLKFYLDGLRLKRHRLTGQSRNHPRDRARIDDQLRMKPREEKSSTQKQHRNPDQKTEEQ